MKKKMPCTGIPYFVNFRLFDNTFRSQTKGLSHASWDKGQITLPDHVPSFSLLRYIHIHVYKHIGCSYEEKFARGSLSHTSLTLSFSILKLSLSILQLRLNVRFLPSEPKTSSRSGIFIPSTHTYAYTCIEAWRYFTSLKVGHLAIAPC